MQEDIKLIDLLIELVDARAPLSSRNPDIDELGKGKARLVLLNKSDLADQQANEQWAAWFSSQGFQVVKLNCRSGAGLKQIGGAVQAACREKIERDRRRGILNRPVRAMVVGIPNVGKSTFINAFAGKACTKTGNKPGVTKGNQWIRLNKSLELLDTPGILWPKFEDQEAGKRLAYIGSINDEILDKEELALELLSFLQEQYPDRVEARYRLGAGTLGRAAEDLPSTIAPDGSPSVPSAPDGSLSVPSPGALLEQIARSRGCLQKGGGCDLARAANLLFDDLRSGKLGPITLEWPNEQSV